MGSLSATCRLFLSLVNESNLTMTTVLAVDLETTGVDENKDQIIEIAGVLWDADRNRVIESLSSLILPNEEFQLTPEVEGLTHVSQVQVLKHGKGLDQVMNILNPMACGADYLMAHNNEFERRFLKASGSAGQVFAEQKPWIDTMTDLPLGQGGGRSMGQLCYDRGIHNPFPHSALGDVLTMCILFSTFKLADVLHLANSPTVKLIAGVSFHNKDLAKDQGFRWDGVGREWYKEAKQVELLAIIKGCNFNLFQELPDKRRELIGRNGEAV